MLKVTAYSKSPTNYCRHSASEIIRALYDVIMGMSTMQVASFGLVCPHSNVQQLLENVRFSRNFVPKEHEGSFCLIN